MIQAIVISKEYYNRRQAENWIRRHKYNPIKNVHESPKTYRFRIKTPNYDRYDYRMITLTTGIKAVVAYPYTE